jgi:APA family basic amino acid/polyamine antiporter
VSATQNEVAVAPSSELRVAIGLPSAVILVMGGVIGVGIFVNPAIVERLTRSPVLGFAAWSAGGLISLLGACVYAELAARLPATGGEYQYIRAAYGSLPAFLFGWTTLLVVHTGGSAAVAIVLAKNVRLLTGIPEPWTVIVTLAALAGVNCAGVKSGNHTQALLGALKVGLILAVIAAGFSLAPQHQAAPVLRASGPIAGFGAALIPVMFTYGGWQTANFVAGEMKNPRRNLAIALVVGVLAVTLVYLLIDMACLRALGPDALGATLTPAADVVGRFAGPVGARLTAAAVAISALAFLSQGILTGPRVIYAMAKDGYFFRIAGRVSQARRAPTAAIVMMVTWTGALALTGAYERILSYVVSMNFLFFGVSASTLFLLRGRGVGEGGFRAPLHPWSTGAFILACAAIVASAFWSFPIDSLIGYAIMAAGLPAYFWWRRRHVAPGRAGGREAFGDTGVPL